jgi:uncharacterized protein (TIGR03435 family)
MGSYNSSFQQQKAVCTMIFSAKRTLEAAALAGLFLARAFAQPAAAQPAFQFADVHVSAKTTTPYFTGGSLRGEHYILHNATMVNMISLAYGMEEDNILSGPAWLDFNHYDVYASAPRGTSPDNIKLMLQALLADRFHLVVHKDTHPLPSYVLRIDTAKGGSKLRESGGGDGTPGCDETHTPTNPDGSFGHFSTKCHNYSIGAIRSYVQALGRQYILDKPLVDASGLQGTYDFSLEFTFQPAPGGLSIFDAVQNQLGLKIALEQYPTPVLVVDKVDEKPTPNAPGLDKALPPPPPSEFDVSVITPSKPDSPFQGRISGNQVNATGMNLRYLISFAWNLNSDDDDLIANAPKFVTTEKWDILAKASPEAQAIGPDGKRQLDFDLLPHMIQTMLAERFQMKSHLEDRPIDAFTLVAANPKMKKADPLNRTHCKEGPGPDGKDPRIANPILGRLLTCSNMTMAQFAEQIPLLANGYVFTPVLDATGLTDAYDFTLSFSTSGQLHSAPPPPAPSNDPNAASRQSDPNGGLSLQDAMARQLGVKLEKRRRPVQVLVIDHIEEKPTDN